ncbi:MAG TPA: hypothetical protein VL091_14365 [Marinobacter sp.]|nr:hypothetical protein [Marinobacter sp.]
MPGWELVVSQVVATAFIIGGILWCFWAWVVRPHLDRKVAELIEASREIEPAVVRGVKKGVADTIRELPESAWDGTVKESTRQFLKFGSGLFENGLSSFLGNAEDMKQKSSINKQKNDQGSGE